MSIKLSDSIRVGQQKPLEDKYFNELIPYTSTTQVNTLLPKAVRHIGLTVNINGEEYWYKDGIEEYDLVFKSNQKPIEITREELYNDLIPNEKLELNRLYKITGVESWCFSQHLIKAIYLKAITNNTLETNGFGEFYNVNYGLNSVWAGNLLEAGLIDSLEYAVDDLVIWGNLLWKNISGEVGTNLKNFGKYWGDIGLPNYLSESDWLPITPQESNHYNISINVIKYDIENNYISYREDTLENKYEQSFSNLVSNYPNYDIVSSDESYLYYVGGISLFHWGESDTVYGNTIKNSLVLNCNNSSQLLLESSFYNNNFENSLFYKNLIISSSIRNNKVLNSHFLYNHLKGSSVESNEYVKSSFTSNRLDSVVFENNILLNQSSFKSNVFKYISVGFNSLNSSYIINNNLKSPNQVSGVRLYKNTLYESSIQSNMYYIDITFNTLNNGSLISNNIDNEITVYNRISTITKNNLDNNSTINSNNFVEEGKGISGYSKGINNNILNNTCNINSNIVKNSSRIFDHTLEYYSTINGNTLDTDGNIYNNQLIQNGKIDNNILTGHGRIYGNQLDRTSEITNCKLIFSPASGYATTIKSNKLFTGKIQNVDFGNIVNPVGTNPNDPAFGGNALSECIIENVSIIKDLTFPNHGGVGIQFVKMNGFSELKNLTVSSKITGVEFINTVFDENSDFSKLIASDAYLGNGYTRFYIDNKLVTLSNLDETFLPYTGAKKNVNIGSYYFESDLGFKKTGGTGTQALTANGRVFDLNTKLEKGTYTGNSAQDLKNDIDNIQIGGRNFIVLSKLKSYTTYNTKPISELNKITTVFTRKNTDTTDIVEKLNSWTLSISVYIPEDSTYTISGRVIINNTPPSRAKWGTGLASTYGSSLTNDYYDESSGRFVITQRYNGSNEWIFHKQSILSTGDVIALYDLKFEKGNKATDWTPAPEDKQDRLQDITGYIGVGKTDASATEKLDVNGNVKATGFKISTGTDTQTLTANGGVFDLTKKADLVSGKIPATQLPSYVDDVLEFANLASFPATGESGKIYIAIDTNLTYRWGGSSYVVMSSSLALGETSSTAYRGDRGKIAYDHSQATGNPHNTKLEELSDVSGTDTTIVDTDVILKKEIAGIWKKLSWSNIKYTLKTYFDSIYAPKAFNLKIITPSSWVTGTMSETEVLRIEIPANSLSDSDVLRIPFLMINKVGTNGTIQIKGKMSTSTTMPSGGTDQIFQTAIVAATNQFVGLDRSFIIDAGKLKGFPAGNTSYGNSTISSNQILSKSFNITVTNYLYISIQLGNTADQARLEGLQLTNS